MGVNHICAIVCVLLVEQSSTLIVAARTIMEAWFCELWERFILELKETARLTRSLPNNDINEAHVTDLFICKNLLPEKNYTKIKLMKNEFI